MKGVKSGNLNRFCGLERCTRGGGICACLAWALKLPF